MNLLASLLIRSTPFALPDKHVRKIRAPDMPRAGEKERKPKPPKRGPNYGNVQPTIIAYLKTVRSAEPVQIAEAIGIHKDSVRRALRALVKDEKIVCVREACNGKYRRSALWKIADTV